MEQKPKVVVVMPAYNAAKTLHMKVDYNPYEGREVTGAVETVVSRGRVVIDGGTFTGRAGGGSFLKRSAR